tara:strand:- start:802 stop:981 length:180 start_codon:yes stop_codon:yes gene_type:complete
MNMSNEKEFNALDLISKEDRKRLLKSHTKTQLLKKAMTWELIAQQYKEQLIKLQKDKDE